MVGFLLASVWTVANYLFGRQLGRLGHLAFDAVLISVTLAGIHRSTGLRIKKDAVTESPDIQKWMDNYLWVGETVMDRAVGLMSMSKYFEHDRKRD